MSEHKATKEEKEVLEKYLLQFLNLEKRFPLLPGIQNTEAMARLVGLDEDEFLKLRERFKKNAEEAARELLKEEEVTGWMDELPFEPGDTIAALGDSLTDDLQGWFSIFRHAVEISMPEADFNFINAGVSYNTTADALKRLSRDVLAHKPDWVIVALGTFDAQKLHVEPDRPLVSLAGFWENINTIEEAVKQETENPLIWMTPPPVLTEMLQKIRLFEFDIYEADLQNIREILSGKKGYIVDPLGKRMSKDGEIEAWNYLSDGLHPSISGHVNTVRELLRHLTQSEKVQGAELEKPDDLELE